MKKIAIYGASGHGKVVAEIAILKGYTEITYVDDGENNHMPFEVFLQQNHQIPVAFGVGINHIRAKLYHKCIENQLDVVTLIHPKAIISNSVTIGEGTVVMAGVVINTDAKIGKGCIINTGCVIEHDNVIGDFVHVSPLVASAGDVKIGDYTHIGIGTCVIQGTTIGADTIIGAGSVVIQNIEDQKIAYGNPCKTVKDNK